MSTSTRRTVVLSAAAAAAAFGLDKRLAIAAPEVPTQKKPAPSTQRRPPRNAQTPDPLPGFHRYKVGSAECTALYDGIWEKAHDPAFIKNVSIADTKRALAAAKLSTSFVPIPISALVVNVNGKLTLCDAGGGGQVQAFNPQSVFVSGKMMANMRAAGIDPRKIETILISHFHPDHIFGLLASRNNAPVFPNAEIIVPAAEYKWWTDPSLIERLPQARKPLAQRIQSVIPKWKNVLPVEGEDEVVPGIRLVAAPGHTPGHTAFHLSSGDQQLLITSDAVYVPALVAAHPGWHGAYDQDGPTAEASRRRLMDRVVADNMMVCGSHFPWPGVGRIAKDGDGYVFNLDSPSRRVSETQF
jgi:glyoxylase-like metal-dependent hydrolase (beta-lactamase superfamily II)